MHPISLIRYIRIVTAILTPTFLSASVLYTGSQSTGGQRHVAVWVYFTDKPAGAAPTAVSSRALARRRTAGFRPAIGDADLPVSQTYINVIREMGGKLRHSLKWVNAASFLLPLHLLPETAELPFVKEITTVGKYRNPSVERSGSLGKKTASRTGFYGNAFNQLQMLDVPRAHDYLRYRFPGDEPGNGVRIAFFDSGFRLRHRCFSHLHERNAVIASYDFIDMDTSVADPDNVFNEYGHPYYSNDRHGSEVFGIVAAYDPPYYCGTAWGAEFLLARTENTFYDSALDREYELHSEEDNWAAAVEWAETRGADIISSSLGYRSDFQDTIILEFPDGSRDTIRDYSQHHLDGNTTIISRAAREAIERGVIVVSAAGNDGKSILTGDSSLNAPADVEDVISVGMITMNKGMATSSSKGPTADGRFKPDCVAPGFGPSIPNVYEYDDTRYSTTNYGTSFAAPFVSGICALILQAEPSLNPSQVREKLYRFCTHPRGTPRDNVFGRGIPDAFYSCMGEKEVYVSAIDTGGGPLTGAAFLDTNGDTLAVADSGGVGLFTLPGGLPDTFSVSEGSLKRDVPIDSLPAWKTLEPCTLSLTIRSRATIQPIPFCTLYYRIGTADFTWNCDSLGRFTIRNFYHLPLHISASADGFITDTVDFVLRDSIQVRTMLLEPDSGTPPPPDTVTPPVTDTILTVYPTILRRFKENSLTIRITFPEDDNPHRLKALIRSINGQLVWKADCTADVSPFTLSWDARSNGGAYAAPGTYILILYHNGKKIRKKFIITF